MKLLICILFVVLVTLILANSEEDINDYGFCSYELKRKMVVEHCGNIRRRRRSYTYSELTNENKRKYHHIDVIANDTSGGILIRNKRGKYEYCCIPAKNRCQRIFTC